MCSNENNADNIIPNLWLGNEKSALSYTFLKTNNIKYIIRVMQDFDSNTRYREFTYIHVPITDSEVICNRNLILLFDSLSIFIKRKLDNNEGVLVHCKQGHHRSASIIAAFIMKYTNYDFDTTVRFINHIRPCSFTRETCMIRCLYKYYLNLIKNKCQNMKCSLKNGVISCNCIDPQIIYFPAMSF